MSILWHFFVDLIACACVGIYNGSWVNTNPLFIVSIHFYLATESMNPLFTVNTITTANSPDISLQLRFRTMFTSATCDLTYGLGAGCGNLTLNKHFRQTNSTIMFINFTLTSSGAYCYQVICAVMPDPSSSLAPIAQGAINYQSKLNHVLACNY